MMDVNSSQYITLNETTLTPAFLKKAEEDLGETPLIRKICLQRMKQLLSRETDLHPRLENEFLLRFLRPRKFNCKKSVELLKRYYSRRQKFSGVFENFLPSSVENVLKYNWDTVLPLRDTEGRAILVNRCGMWIPSEVTFDELFRCGLLCLETAVENPVTQVCGIINLIDMKGLAMEQLKQFSLSRLYCFVFTLQDAFPCRLKAIHIVNEPKIFTKLYSIIRPLLTNKMKNRVVCHGDNMESLHQYLPAAILPEEYGGDLGPFNNNNFSQIVLENEQRFIEDKEYGYTIGLEE